MLGLTQVFGKEKVVGVDIGSRFIKAVQAEAGRSPGSWRIIKAAITPTPNDSVRDGIVIDQAAVAAALRTMLGDAGIEANAVVAAISGTSVIVRHVKLPRMPESVLRKSVRFEAAKHISSSVEDSMIEFEITGPVPGEDDKMSVMLVAAPSDMVESRLSALAQAGLEPVAIDVEAFALQRALVDLSPTRPGEGTTLALLDIGATTTDVNIIANGLFALTRNIPIAGDSFTQAIKAVAKVDSHGNLEIPRQALANAVRATKDFAGLTGSITVDPNGDRVASAADDEDDLVPGAELHAGLDLVLADVALFDVGFQRHPSPPARSLSQAERCSQ